MTIANPRPAFDNPISVTSAFGRFFYAGGSNVYYSQSLVSAKVAGKCYQNNDPTSEQSPDLLATDGGVIALDDSVNIIALQPFRTGVLVFAQNGVWYIYNPDGGFTATRFNVSKITERGIESPKSVVAAEGRIYYFSDNGIMQVVANEFDNLMAEDVTETTIRSYFIDNFIGRDCTVNYDSQNKTIVWWTKGQPSRGLLLDLRSNGFYPQLNANTTRSIGRPLNINASFFYPSWEDTGTTFSYSFAQTNDRTFQDFGTDQEAYLVTGYETLGKFAHKKAVTQCMVMLEKTETQITGYEDGEYTFDFPSSCLFQSRWDFDNSNAFNKWVGVTNRSTGTGQAIQMYNPIQRGFIPETIPWDFDTR